MEFFKYRTLVWIFFIGMGFQACEYSIKAEKRYSDGKIESVGYIKDGKKNGTAQTFYPNGIVKEEGNWIDDKQEGIWKYYNEDGSLYAIVSFKNDKQDGKSVFYYPNKNISEESYFVNGMLDGITKKYFQNGKLKEVANWSKGKKDGETVLYDSASDKLTKAIYSKGEIVKE